MRTKLALLALVLVCIGCGGPNTPHSSSTVFGGGPNTPHSSSTVFGKCRFCAKPGYSSANYVDSTAAQQAAEEGDVTITARIVCGDCRKKMEVPK